MARFIKLLSSNNKTDFSCDISLRNAAQNSKHLGLNAEALKAPTRDLGQWDVTDPLVSKWFRELKQPDNPSRSCCGESDAYWADDYEVSGDHYIAIITDIRDDKPLRRPHVENGTRFIVPKNKIQWDRGNPTGHGIIFIGPDEDVYCYLPPEGG